MQSCHKFVRSPFVQLATVYFALRKLDFVTGIPEFVYSYNAKCLCAQVDRCKNYLEPWEK